jgi:hypothetical protein
MAKTVLLKLDDPTYRNAEKIRKRLKLPRSTKLLILDYGEESLSN